MAERDSFDELHKLSESIRPCLVQRLLLDERLDELHELAESGLGPTIRHLSDQLTANGQVDGLGQHALHGQDEVLKDRL